jgi:hypothetical protein
MMIIIWKSRLMTFRSSEHSTKVHPPACLVRTKLFDTFHYRFDKVHRHLLQVLLGLVTCEFTKLVATVKYERNSDCYFSGIIV